MSLTAYVRYDNTGRIVPGGPIVTSVKPKVGDWLAVDEVLTTVPNYKLRGFIRYIKNGNYVAGSLILQHDVPQDGNWKEVYVLKPAIGSTTTTTTTIPPVDRGLITYLDAGNPASYSGTGSTWYDLTSNHYDATLVASVTYSTANGGAMVTNHDNSQITIANSGQYNFQGQAFSVSMWINSSLWNQAGNCQTLIDFETGGWVGWLMRHCSSNSYMGGRQDQQISSTMPSLSTWVNMTFTTDGNNFKMYWDGTLDYSSSGLNYSGASYTPYGIGCNGEATGQGFGGLIGSVQIYNVELSGAEVTENYNATKGRFITP